jgi:glutamate 5-kinase
MPSTIVRNKIVSRAKKIIVKIGTNALTDSAGQLDVRMISSMANQVFALVQTGKDVVIVSSGAIGAGMGVLGLKTRPKELPLLQASAAVGQGRLMQIFEKTFSKHNLHVGQVLVTRADFVDRRRYINIERTLNALSELRVIPIINENDTVAVDENRFGDNDLIAAMVANLVHADLLVLLTVVDGLLDQNGQRVDFVPKVDDQTLAFLRPDKSALGSGGMQSKLQAVKLATTAGIDTIIANGKKPNALTQLILDGEKIGTVFVGNSKRVTGKLRWVMSAAKPAGQILIDEGASRAVIAGGKSLLPTGIIGVHGSFELNDVVTVINQQGSELARGITNYSSSDLLKIKGLRSEAIKKIFGSDALEEAIHRDNLIVTAG